MKNNKKIKVVFGINDFLVGGAQRLIVDLFSRLDKNTFELHLITLFQFDDKMNFYSLLPLNVSVHRYDFNGFLDLSEWFKVFYILRKIKPDILVSNLFFSNTIFRILNLFIGFKIIIVEHNTYIMKSTLQRFTDKILSYITYRIIAVSNTVMNFTAVQEHIPMGKFMVINNGIDPDFFKREKESQDKQKLKSTIGFDGTSKIIINVGRLTAQKNHRLLIEAFPKFSIKHPQYKLIILGKGSLRDELKKTINKLGSKNSIFLLGARKDLHKYYLASDFFVSTSLIEGVGIAHTEAMACGLPVLSTKTAGPDKMIKEGINGYFILEPTIESVFKGLGKMIESPLSVMGQAAMEISHYFPIDKTVSKYEKLFLKIMNT